METIDKDGDIWFGIDKYPDAPKEETPIEEIIIDKSYFKTPGDSSSDCDGESEPQSQPSSGDQLRDFADMVKAIKDFEAMKEMKRQQIEQQRIQERAQQMIDDEEGDWLEPFEFDLDEPEEMDESDEDTDHFEGSGSGLTRDGSQETRQGDNERINVPKKNRSWWTR